MPKWTTMHISQKFLDNLREHFGTSVFSVKMAYVVYADHHCRHVKRQRLAGLESYGGYWMEMNVRNNVAAAAYRGQLMRLNRGKYRFPVPDEENELEEYKD